MIEFAPGCFWSPYIWPTFLSIFPWSPLGKISQNGRSRSPLQICHNSAPRALMEAQFAAKCSSMIALQVRTTLTTMRFARGCFWSPYSRPTFLSIFPWSPLGKISENGRFRSPWQICHNSAPRALMEAQFAANVPLWLHLKSIQIRRWCNLRQGVFEARIVGLLFWAFSLGPLLAKSQNMADLGLLGKFVITRLHGHLWRRSLQQNVPLWLHFKCILIRRWCDLRQGVFEARTIGLLFWAFSLGPPLAKS